MRVSPDDLALRLDARARVQRRGWGRASAVLAALFDRDGATHVVLTKRTDTVRTHKGQYALPGGARDADDATIVDTALRETEEEVGLPRREVRVLGLLDDLPTVTGFTVTPVVGWVAGDPVFTPNEREVAFVLPVPLDAIVHPPRSHNVLYDGLRRLVLAYEIDGHFIWGATARILRNLGDVVRSR